MMRALLCCVGLFGVVGLTSTSALAQGKKKAFVPKTQTATQPELRRKRTKKEKKGPSLDAARMERGGRGGSKSMVEAKWRESFNLLKKLIDATPNSSPEKPELYYRMSEMFWERASSRTIRAFDEEERCLSAARGESAQNRCVAKRKQGEAEAQADRDQAIKIYRAIVQNFPNYPKLDGVLFALGYNYLRKGEAEGAKKIFAALIRRYPKSPYMPDTLLNLGEIYFEDGDVQAARKFYGKVAAVYKKSSVYGYSVYKLGWCFFNMGDYTNALRQFLAVIDHTKKSRRGGKNRIQLRKEAERDLVRTYVNIPGANPTKAIGFFRKVAPDSYLKLSERLAELYADTGQFENSNKLFRELIRLQKGTYATFGYQLQILINTRNIGANPIQTVKELKRLVTLWKKVRNAKDADPKRVKKDEAGIEEQLRVMAVTYHQQALKTNNPKDYALAYELYSDYIKVFPEGPNAYDMTFYFGELLYKQKKWKLAARAYEKVLKMKPSGKEDYTKDAAHGTVLSYKKLLQPTQARPATKTAKNGKQGDAPVEVPKPKTIPEDYQRFLDAMALYIKYVKNSEYLVDIKYDEARIYYEFNHFDKAIPRFKEISEKHSEHRLAIFAANLLLDTYSLTKNIDAQHAQAKTYLKLYPEERDPQLNALCKEIIQKYDFNKCRSFEGDRQYIKTARCFLRYAQRFKESEDVDKAYENAARNFEREKRIEDAIQARLALVNNVSGSPLVPEALYKIGLNLQALAIFSKASDALEFFGKKFPEREEAKEALRRAAVFRLGLGQYEKAEKVSREYLKLVGKKDAAKAALVYFGLGEIFEKQNDWPRVVRHYKQFLKNYRDSGQINLLLEAHTRIGNAYMSMKPKDTRKAQRAYKDAFESFKKLSKTQVEKLESRGRSAVAEARFKMGEAIFSEFKRTPLKIRARRNVQRHIKEMVKKIVKKSEIAARAKNVFEEVIKYGSPTWAIAGLARIGQIYEELYNEIYNVPAPKSFDEEQTEIFKGAMTDRSEPQRLKARDAFETCLREASRLKWFNKWSDLAERRLADLMPEKYRYNAEKRATPTNFGPDVVGKSFIAKLDEPVAPEDDAEEGGQ
jgi:TolA-binding protein